MFWGTEFKRIFSRGATCYRCRLSVLHVSRVFYMRCNLQCYRGSHQYAILRRQTLRALDTSAKPILRARISQATKDAHTYTYIHTHKHTRRLLLSWLPLAIRVAISRISRHLEDGNRSRRSERGNPTRHQRVIEKTLSMDKPFMLISS